VCKDEGVVVCAVEGAFSHARRRNSYNYRGVYEQHQPTITRPIVIIERTGR
jgi:hypothetical protein